MKNSSTGNKTFIAICGSINFSSYFHPTEEVTEDYIVLDFPTGKNYKEAWNNYEKRLATLFSKEHLLDLLEHSILYRINRPGSDYHCSSRTQKQIEESLPF